MATATLQRHQASGFVAPTSLFRRQQGRGPVVGDSNSRSGKDGAPFLSRRAASLVRMSSSESSWDGAANNNGKKSGGGGGRIEQLEFKIYPDGTRYNKAICGQSGKGAVRGNPAPRRYATLPWLLLSLTALSFFLRYFHFRRAFYSVATTNDENTHRTLYQLSRNERAIDREKYNIYFYYSCIPRLRKKRPRRGDRPRRQGE